MNTNTVVSIPPTKVAHSCLDKFQLALQAVEPSKSKKRQDAIIEAYDTIKQHAERKVPWKTIVAKFNEAYALAMHPARLRKEFDEERKRRENAYGIEGFEQANHEEADETERVHEEITA